MASTSHVVVQVAKTAGSEHFAPCIELRLANGGPVENGRVCQFGGSEHVDLSLPPGRYFALVSDDDNRDTGSYNVVFVPIPLDTAAPLAADVPIAAALDDVGDIDAFRFALPGDTRIILQAARTIESDAFAPCIELRFGSGPPTR